MAQRQDERAIAPPAICPECETRMPWPGLLCPNCGWRPNRPATGEWRVVLATVLSVLVLVLAGYFFGE